MGDHTAKELSQSIILEIILIKPFKSSKVDAAGCGFDEKRRSDMVSYKIA
jgi:hypothetical protein